MRPPFAFVRQIGKKLLTKYLFVTNTVTSGILMASADVIQQTIEKTKEEKPYETPRTGRMMTVGLAIAPFMHFWYGFLDKTLPGTARRTVIKKVGTDQLIASPMLIVGFFLGMGKLEGKSIPTALVELKEKFLFIYLVDCFFWPPVQALNFLFVPPHWRVIYVNVAVLVWDVFLSYMKHKGHHHHVDVERISDTLPLVTKDQLKEN